jgi:NAD+ synthase (glutamine-hydrolysing)
MKIALAQINTHIGNFEYNTQKIIQTIERAKKEGADLVVFPELAVCGYPPLDFLEFGDFVLRCDEAIAAISQVCVGIACIVGAPAVNRKMEGKNLHNTAFFLEDGKIKQQVNKTLLPNYDVFDECRYFEPNSSFTCIHFMGERIALTICEDLWDVEEDKLYVKWPMDELILQKPTVMINIAASPFNYLQVENRKRVLNQSAKKYELPIFYVNHAGAQTELIFDGGSLVMNKHGNVVTELSYFEEDFSVFELDWVKTARSVPFETELQFSVPDIHISRIHKALITGIKDYFRKLNFSKAVLGLSGGIDSAVVYALAIEALGKENVMGVLMPSPYSSGHSISDSLELAERLGGKTDLIPISGLFDEFNRTLSNQFSGLAPNIAEENIQARIRGVLLMALSNKFGSILLNTSNKSEAAVGYGTLYGDMAGGLSVIGDLYKTQVYLLADFMNKDREIIPESILTKAPSAELRPDQKDSDSLPDYEILDKILFHYIEECKGPSAICKAGFDKTLVDRVLKLVNTNEYKRYQTPPVLRVSPKAFGLGRRMPIVGKYLS